MRPSRSTRNGRRTLLSSARALAALAALASTWFSGCLGSDGGGADAGFELAYYDAFVPPVPAVCGDGYIDTAADETCEPGFDEIPCDPVRCVRPACGDGVIDRVAGETCEPGGLAFRFALGPCDETCRHVFVLPPESCGDGLVQPSFGEDCDRGVEGPSTCDSNCQRVVCGDGRVSGDEGCDDANQESGDGCTPDCTPEFCGDGSVQRALGESCEPAEPGCDFDCTPTECGDGTWARSEQCDDGNQLSDDGCTPDCVLEFCGDGKVQSSLGEACDDGNALAEDGCTPDCVLEFCGDGVIQRRLGERCDDGRGNRDQGACGRDCQAARCGDGVVQAGAREECDDSGTTAGDGCDDHCRREYCGDGRLQPALGEVCDDPSGLTWGPCDALCQTNPAPAEGFGPPADLPEMRQLSMSTDAAGRAALVALDAGLGLTLLRFDGSAWGAPLPLVMGPRGPGGLAASLGPDEPSDGRPNPVALLDDGSVVLAYTRFGWVDEPPAALHLVTVGADDTFTDVDLGGLVATSRPALLRAGDAVALAWLAPVDPLPGEPAPAVPARSLRVVTVGAAGPSPTVELATDEPDPADPEAGLGEPLLLPRGGDVTVAVRLGESLLAFPVSTAAPAPSPPVTIARLGADARLAGWVGLGLPDGRARLRYIVDAGGGLARLRSVLLDAAGLPAGVPEDGGLATALLPGDHMVATALRDGGELLCMSRGPGQRPSELTPGSGALCRLRTPAGEETPLILGATGARQRHLAVVPRGNDGALLVFDQWHPVVPAWLVQSVGPDQGPALSGELLPAAFGRLVEQVSAPLPDGRILLVGARPAARSEALVFGD